MKSRERRKRMNWKEALARITGFNVPVFGVSWNPPQPEIAVARRALAFLEDRRVLYNPYHLEVADHCVESVVDIRRFLTDLIGQLPPSSTLAEHLRAIRAACRTFLDDTSPGTRHALGPHWAGPFETSFFTALGELRARIGVHVAAIAVMHGIDVEGELASVLPEAPGEGDA
jgi:hypothetical protein